MRSGAGAVVLVEGEPGMGKTRLLAEAARVARRLAFRVGAGAAEPGAEIVELAPLMTAVRRARGGEHVFRCGEQDFHVGPGATVFAPRGPAAYAEASAKYGITWLDG